MSKADSSRVLRAAVVIAMLGGAGVVLAQTPPTGGILRDVERSLPTRPITSPEGARIEVPDVPAMDSASAERVSVRGYRIRGNTVFEEETLLSVISDATGQKTVSELNAVAERLTSYYRDHGYLLARAYVPRQEIKDGLISIAILEGRYDQVDTTSTARVSDRRVERTVIAPVCPQQPEDCKGALISRAPLERGLLLLNDTPGAQAAARLAPGEITGTSTLGVNALADALMSGYVQADNGGSYYSGVARGIGTLWINSPTGIGDQITLQGVATAVHGELYYGSLGYGVPLGYSGARLAVRGSYLRYELGDRYESLEAHGTVRAGDATLFYPFVRSLQANLYGSAGYGERRFEDMADEVGVDTERRISDRTELALNGDLRDELFGVPAFNTLSLIYTRGQVELDPSLWLVDALTAHTEGRYDKWMVSYSRLQPLFGATSLFLRAAVQGTSDNLDSYEKFSLGGADSVRAYPASDTLVDESVLYSAEVRQRFAVSWMHGLEGMLFYDRARGDRNAEPWDNTPNRVTLSGVGVGLNCALNERTTLRSTMATRGNRPMTAAPDSDWHYNVSLNMMF